MANFPRNPPFQDGVDILGADTFNSMEERASAAIQEAVTTIVGPNPPQDPNPPTGTEYVWFQTDGNGNLLDILSGVVS